MAAAVLAVHIVCFGAYIADDAGITFAYAKNLAQGHGLTLNPGTDPVEGYSSFAWLLVVLPFCARRADPTWGVKLSSFVFGAGTLFLMGAIGRTLAGADRERSWIRDAAIVGLAAFTPFAVWSIGGLENPLNAFLLMAAVYAYVTGRLIWCACALCALAMTRIENLAFATVFVAHRASVLIAARRAPSRSDAIAASVFVVAYGGYTGWHWRHFQAFFPNTYIAKAPALDPAGALRQLTHLDSGGWHYLQRDLLAPYNFYAAVAFIVLSMWTIDIAAALLLAALLVAAVSLVVLSGGDFYPEFRLGTMLLPPAFLLFGEGLRAATRRLRSARVAGLAAAVPLLLVCAPSAWHTARFERPTDFSTIRLGSYYNDIAKRLGQPHLTVVESDIGNAAYFTDFTIIDLGGLANLDIARFGRHFFLDYVFKEIRPDVIRVRGVWAAQAEIPFALMERDYATFDGGASPAGYADGTFIRRELVGRSPGAGAAARAAECADAARALGDAQALTEGRSRSSVEETFRRVNRYCAAACAACRDRVALSAQAEAIAARYERGFWFADAFAWYAAAFDADPLNVAALRHREDMRLAADGPGALLERGRLREAREFYAGLFAKGWRPRTPAEVRGVEEVVAQAGLRVPVDWRRNF